MKSSIIVCILFLAIYFPSTLLVAQRVDVNNEYLWNIVDAKITGSNTTIKIVTKGGEKHLEWYNPKKMVVNIEIREAKAPASKDGKISISRKKFNMASWTNSMPIKQMQKDNDLLPGYYAVNVITDLQHKSDWLVFILK